MREYLIKKRINELCEKGYLQKDDITKLFYEYEQDKLNNVPLEDSIARSVLIMGNKKLVYFLLKTKLNIELKGNLDDLEEFSVAQIGLIKAIDTYDVNKGVTFSTYASRVIVNEVLMYYRKLNKMENLAEKNKIFFDDCVGEMDKRGHQLTLSDFIPDDYDFVEEILDQETYNSILRNMKYLTYREAFTIIHYFGLHNNKPILQHQIAQILGINRTMISKAYSSGIHKIRVLSVREEDLSPEEMCLKERMLKRGAQNELYKKVLECQNLYDVDDILI